MLATVSRPEFYLPIEVQGALRLIAPTGRPVGLVAEGASLRLDVPGWRELTALAPMSFRSRRKTLRRAAAALAAGGLTFSVESRGRLVLQIGEGVRTSLIGRLFGLTGAHIPFSGIAALFRR